MKASSDFIWHLIHSLSSNEKLFFKRNFVVAHSAGDRLYLKLFSAIAAQKKYDEAALLKKFHPALNKRNMASQKHYLQKQVCDALVQYDGRNNVNQDIYNQVQLVRVFRKKGLLDEARAIWKKAVKKARETESFALLNLLKTEFEKMILLSSVHTKYDELHSLFKSNLITYDQYANMITLRDIYTETLLLKRKTHFDLDDDLTNKLQSLLAQVEKCKDAPHSPSFWFRHYFFINKATLLYLLNDVDSSMDLLKKLLSDWKQNSSFVISHGEHYIELMYMINYAGVLHGEYDFVERSFNESITDLVKDPVQRANFEAIKYLALNKIYNKTARYDEVEKLVRFMKAKYQQWEPVLNSDMNRTVNLSLGIGSFVLERYDDSLYFTKRAITFFKDGTREEQSSVAQVLLLLVAYNLNNQKLFDAQYRNTYTYFYKRKQKHIFETALVQCLHRCFYMTDHKTKMQEYQKTLEIFEQNKNDRFQQMIVSIFNYPGWIASKIQRTSYRTFVERNIKKKIELV